jgi:hypothetical protein
MRMKTSQRKTLRSLHVIGGELTEDDSTFHVEADIANLVQVDYAFRFSVLNKENSQSVLSK